MRHDGGLHNLHKRVEVHDAWTENLKLNKVGEIIEDDSCFFDDGDKSRRYHAFSRDWIANEIFRRIEPDGKTMG